jgi:hypothetical protein
MDFQANGRRIHHPSRLPSGLPSTLRVNRASRVRRGRPSRLPSGLRVNRASKGRRAEREHPSRLRASRLAPRVSHGSAARLRGGELVGDCLAREAGRWRTCARLRAASHSPIWVARSGVVAARLQGTAVVRAQAEAYATVREITHTPPPPGVVRMNLKRKGLQKGMLEVVENKGAICTKIAPGCASPT